MDKRKNQYHDPWDNEIYGTGSTKPPKNHGGKVAVILMVGIFICGMVSTFGLLKIRLFSLNAHDSTISIDFYGTGNETDITVSGSQTVTEAQEQDDVKAENTTLGITGESISRFHQKFYRWPAGLYITKVREGSDAEKNKIVAGDILVSVDGISAEDISAVQERLQSCRPGDQVTLVIYRDSILLSVDIVLSQSNS